MTMQILAKVLRPSRWAMDVAAETDDIRSDLQAKLGRQTFHVPFSGGDLLLLHRAVAGGLGGCPCADCDRVRAIVADQLHQLQRLQMDDLTRDRIRLLIDPSDRWHPGLMAAAQRLAERDGQGGQQP